MNNIHRKVRTANPTELFFNSDYWRLLSKPSAPASDMMFRRIIGIPHDWDPGIPKVTL
jgi:hypothetical protein